jgi:hypothetical protein
MRRCLLFAVVCFLPTMEQAFSSASSGDEETLWNLEHAYWQYVEKNDLAAYSNLWHKDFLVGRRLAPSLSVKITLPTGLPPKPAKVCHSKPGSLSLLEFK